MGKVSRALNKILAYNQDLEGVQGLGDVDSSGLDNPKLDEARPEEMAAGVAGFAGPAPEVVAGIEGWDDKLVVFSDPSSTLSENFRLLRAQILYPPSGKPYKKILITSTMPGSGKSFVCANLGISLAQGLDQHALLVDCDLRRSKLAAMFNCPTSRGLVNHLRDGEDLGRLIAKTGMRKLSLIPSGPQPANPAELLGSAKVDRMFAELSSRYNDRFILIDTPPTQEASETAVLAQHVDGVVLVIRWGLGDRGPLKQLVDSLDQDKIIGVVFNAYTSSKLSVRLSGYDEYGQFPGSYGK